MTLAIAVAPGASPGPVDPAAPASAGAAEKADGISFHDVLSALNPLQYLPIIGMIYRAVTGDRPAPAVQLGGAALSGLLMGGPVGVVTSMVGFGLEALFDRVVGAAGGDAPPADTAPDAATRFVALNGYRKVMGMEPAAGGAG